MHKSIRDFDAAVGGWRPGKGPCLASLSEMAYICDVRWVGIDAVSKGRPISVGRECRLTGGVTLGLCVVPMVCLYGALAPHLRAAPAQAASTPAAVSETEAAHVILPLPLRWDLWWADGLNYMRQGRRGPSRAEGGLPWIPGERVTLAGKVGAKVSLDAAAFDASAGQQEVADDRELRDARLYTSGYWEWFERTFYKLELGLVDRDFLWNETYLRWESVPVLDRVTIGYLDALVSMENAGAFGARMLMEKAAPIQAFAPATRLGLELNRAWLDRRVTGALGLSSAGQNDPFESGDATDDLVRISGRVTGVPHRREGGTTPSLLHLGASFSSVLAEESSIQYRTRPESHLAPMLVDTGELDAEQAITGGLEAAYVLGPFSVQAEALASRVLMETAAELDFSGLYGQASWFLTGESRPYNEREGGFARVAPRRPFAPGSGAWGAWELALRGSWLDLSDGPVDGGHMAIVTPGVNWHWTENLRVQANYGIADVSGGASPGDLDMVQVRLQLVF